MKTIHIKKNIKGMSLLESILAVGLVMSVVIGSITMSISTIHIGRNSNNRIVALNLAREGMEYVRNLRDSNWLKESEGIEIIPGQIYKWNDGITSGTHILNQYLNASGEWVSVLVFLDLDVNYDIKTCVDSYSCKLRITSDGIYNHVDNNGEYSNFSRIITITNIPEVLPRRAHINVTSEIHWFENGRDKTFVLEENLFDWRDD